MKKHWTANLKRFRNIRAELDPKRLYLLWFVGACVVASMVATHMFAMSALQGSDKKIDIGNKEMDDHEQMTVTIFTAPAPFEGNVGIQQGVAINSWLRLDPCPNVVLLGQHASLHVFATNRAPKVTVDTDIDFTFSGKPLFDGMVRRALNCSSDVVMLIDPDIILLRLVFRAIQSVRGIDQDWLITALPLVVADFPFSLQGENFESSGASVDEEQVEALVRKDGIWDTCDGAQLWAWNGSRRPLYAGDMPVFTYKDGHHNHWLLSEAITSKYRAVIDASEAFNVFRTQRAGNSPHETGNVSVGGLTGGNKMYQVGDSWVAPTDGSFHFKNYNFSNMSLELLNCGRMPSERFCMMNTSQHTCSCSPLSTHLTREKGTTPLFDHLRTWTSWFGALVGRTDKGSVAGSLDKKNQGINCGCHSLPNRTRFQCVASQNDESDVSYSLESSVRRVANEDKVVILAVVGDSYRDMLMSWICRLKHLQISNFLISALDDDLFHFAVQQGLPVVRTSVDLNVSRPDKCQYGTPCFKSVTKVKSRVVLQILQLGFHVLFSDVDIYWFEDPLKELMSFGGPGHLAAQTDQRHKAKRINTPQNLNSGFYFAWSDEQTMAAFESIIKHAAASNRSEQPSFYDVLCGEGGIYAFGRDICLNPMFNVTVHFLDPVKYPNGAIGNVWKRKNVRSACMAQGCKILHNNWVSGKEKKILRQTTAGLWDYDVATHMCSENMTAIMTANTTANVTANVTSPKH